MTKKQKKQQMTIKKRCRVERLTKLIVYVSVIVVIFGGEYLQLSGNVVSFISITIWFVAPDVTAYVLENVFNIKHRKDVYR